MFCKVLNLHWSNQKEKDITELWRIPLRWFLCIVLLFCKLCHTSFVTPHQLTWKCIHKPPVVVQAFGAETVKLWWQRGNEKKNCLPFLNRLLFQPSQLRFTLSHLAHWGRVEISQLVALNWTKNKPALAKLARLNAYYLPFSLIPSTDSLTHSFFHGGPIWFTLSECNSTFNGMWQRFPLLHTRTHAHRARVDVYKVARQVGLN